jgi:hypothetical protein
MWRIVVASNAARAGMAERQSVPETVRMLFGLVFRNGAAETARVQFNVSREGVWTV